MERRILPAVCVLCRRQVKYGALCLTCCVCAMQTSSEVWNAVSDCAKDLLNKMLVVDVHRRITADDALKHVWIQVTSSCTSSIVSVGHFPEL